MEANETEQGTRDQGSQALQEFQRRRDDMRGVITVIRSNPLSFENLNLV
jgi:hypothetical protein